MRLLSVIDVSSDILSLVSKAFWNRTSCPLSASTQDALRNYHNGVWDAKTEARRDWQTLVHSERPRGCVLRGPQRILGAPIPGTLNCACDVVDLQIVSHLLPADLLSLSRVSKRVRSLVFSPSSRYLWTAARGNVVPNLPLPARISEPRFANLLFGQFCMVSRQSGVPRLLLSLTLQRLR